MGYSADDLARLRLALTSGEKRVRFADGREVEYRSIAEIKSAIGIVEHALGFGRPSSTLAVFARD